MMLPWRSGLFVTVRYMYQAYEAKFRQISCMAKSISQVCCVFKDTKLNLGCCALHRALSENNGEFLEV